MPKKIEKFACEPVAFYLHKKNDFLHRLEGRKNEEKFREEKGFRTMIKNILTHKAGQGERFKMQSSSSGAGGPLTFKEKMNRLKQIAAQRELSKSQARTQNVYSESNTPKSGMGSPYSHRKRNSVKYETAS
jgi:hypothetical protein